MKLSPKKILDKKFESMINGYSPTKVDKFLDDVINDYNFMLSEIDQLNKLIKEKENIINENNKIINQLENEIIELKSKYEIDEKNNS